MIGRKTILFPGAASPVPLPMPLPDVAGSHLTESHLRTFGDLPNLGVYSFENCFISNGGHVFDNDTKKMHDADDLTHSYWRDQLLARVKDSGLGDPFSYFSSTMNLRKTNAPDSKEIYVRLVLPGYSVYGHWPLDLLPAAWMFQKFFNLKEQPVTFVIAHDTPEWAIEMVRLVLSGQHISFLKYDPARETLHFDRLYVPSFLRKSPIMSEVFGQFVADLQSKIRMHDNAPKRILITRSDRKFSSDRRSLNWKEIENTFVKNGFSVFRPEELSWEEQISLFSQADFVAGEFGSAIHTTLFSAAGTKVLALSHSRMNMNQSAISATRRHNLQYIPSLDEEYENASVSYRHDMSLVQHCIREMDSI